MDIVQDQVQIQDLVGVPFLNKGRNKDEGFDCWGLAMEVFKRYGINIPDYDIDCMDMDTIQRTEEVQKGCGLWEEVTVLGGADGGCGRGLIEGVVPLLVLIRNHPIFYNHVGVHIGYGRIIHCQEKMGVVIERINRGLSKRIGGYYRWIGDKSVI